MTSKSHVLILGGTHGLGAEILALFQRQGESVISVGRTAETSGNIRGLKCDLGDANSVNDLIVHLQKLTSSGAQISHFFWVAGMLTRTPFTDIAQVGIQQMIDINLRNPLLIAQWVWQHMQSQSKYSHYSVISSTVGISDSPRDDEAVYAATKSAQVSFARAIGKNNKNDFVRMSLVCPGGMKTPFWTTNAVDAEAYDSFLEPRFVAEKIVATIGSQVATYQELVIPRTQKKV